jgi:hypothetical protein
MRNAAQRPAAGRKVRRCSGQCNAASDGRLQRSPSDDFDDTSAASYPIGLQRMISAHLTSIEIIEKVNPLDSRLGTSENYV